MSIELEWFAYCDTLQITFVTENVVPSALQDASGSHWSGHKVSSQNFCEQG